MRERRGYVRLSESLKIAYNIIDVSSVKGSGISDNISGAGICFPTKHQLHCGNKVKLEISLPHVSEPIVAKGIIVWFRLQKDVEFPYIVGIKFTDIDPFDQGKILNFIRDSIKEGREKEIKWID